MEMLSFIKNNRLQNEKFERYFNVDCNNKIVFYPWGRFGKGYILDSISQKKDWKPKFVSAFTIFFLGIIGSIVIGVIFNNLLFIVWGIIGTILTYTALLWKLRILYRHLPTTNKSFVPETLDKFIQNKSTSYLIIASIYLFFIAIFALYLGYTKHPDRPAVIAALIVSGFSLYLAQKYTKALVSRIKKAKLSV